MAIYNITESDFEEKVIKSKKVVIVDFWAEWCGPCKLISKNLKEISKDYEDKLDIAKVDIDDNQALSTKYGVRGIPTLLLIKDKEVVAKTVGAMSKEMLIDWFEEYLE